MIKARDCATALLTGWLLIGAAVAAPQFVNGPGPRRDHAMTYDSQRQVVVLFGGAQGATWSGETWEWDGVAWTLRQPVNSPSARSGGAMTFDATRGVCVYFGGYNGSNLNDTWEWNGVDWVQRAPAAAPSARHSTNMVYDTSRQVCVLFGRQAPFDGSTWEWNGTSWLEVATTGPSPRYQQAMAFDAQRAVTVLHGGWNGAALNDTWEWDGAQWTQVSTATTPPLRTNAAMCYDTAQGHAVLFGGFNGTSWLDDTWTFDGVNWTLATPPIHPAARNYTAMAFDAARGNCVLFGGHTGSLLADTWTFGGEWRPKLSYSVSPTNGNRYALTPQMSWTDSEAVAQSLGGHLATVRSAAENAWLVATFGNGSECHWIGLNDAQTEGQFVWASGEPVTYQNWHPNEPSNGNGIEDWCHIGVPWNGVSSLWNDLPNVLSHSGAVCRGIIELPDPVTSNATTYGSGCGQPALTFTPTNNPDIGTIASARISNAPQPLGGVTMGWSDSHVSGIPLLPLDLAFVGMPGCLLHHSNDVFGLPVTVLTASTLQFDYAIPAQTALLGTHVYLQAYCLAPNVNQLQFVASNGIDWLIGNQ